MQIFIGADPELFVKDRKTNKFVSGHDCCPGSKRQPHNVPHGAVQVDGVALEYNINPADNQGSFLIHNCAVMRTLKKRLEVKNPDYSLCIAPMATFDQAYWDALPPTVKELGCDPDYDAYTGMVKDRPDIADQPIRFASGHIHIGWINGKDADKVDVFEEGHFNDCKELAYQLDIALGIPSFLWDKGKDRRKYYGKLGTFRPKKYGMEYRVLSNQWLKNWDTIRYVFVAAQNATLDFGSQELNYFDYMKEGEVHRIFEKMMNEKDLDKIDWMVSEFFESNRFLIKPPGFKKSEEKKAA
jgi:hypothetical protein